MNKATLAAMVAVTASIGLIYVQTTIQETSIADLDMSVFGDTVDEAAEHPTASKPLRTTASSTYDPSAYYRDAFIAHDCIKAAEKRGDETNGCNIPVHPSHTFEDGMTPADRLMEEMLKDKRD